MAPKWNGIYPRIHAAAHGVCLLTRDPPRKKILKKNSFKAEIPAVSTFRAKYASANMGAGSMDGKHVSPVVAKLLPQSNMIAPVEAMVDGTQGGSMAIAE